MEKDKLKLELLEKIINCDDAAVLKAVEEIFTGFSEVKEGGENYIKELDPVPASHYQKLEEEFRKYKSGEVKGISWEKFRQEVKNTHGF
jgi:hypothetical protein